MIRNGVDCTFGAGTIATMVARDRHPHAGSTTPPAVWQLLARLWWASLVVIHLPVFATVVRAAIDTGLSADRLGSLIALGVTIALFTAKLLDAPFLRLRQRRQAILATCLATAIMHHEVFAAPRQEWAAAPAVVVLIAAAISAEPRRLKRTLSVLSRALTRVMGAVPACLIVHPNRCGYDIRTLWTHERRRCCFQASAPRAPPRSD